MAILNSIRAYFNLLVIITLIGVIIYLYYKNIEKDKIILSQKKVADKAVKIIERRTDEIGQQHATFEAKAQEITKEEAKTPSVKSTLDTVAKALNIQAKQIEEWQKVAVTSQAKELQAVKSLDSLKKKSRYEFKNKWIALGYEEGDLDPITGHPKPGKFDYKYNVDLNHVEYKGKWWENKRYIDVYANDTNAVIAGIDRYRIISEGSKLHGSLRQYNTYNSGSKVFASGLQAELNIKRINMQAGYFYNYLTKEWETRYGLGFSLIRKR